MKKNLIAAAAALLFAASFQSGAQQSAPKGPAEARIRASDLFTQEERDQYREKMRAAKTREERAQVQQQIRAATEQRAREKGVTLPQRRDAGEGARRGPPGAPLLSNEEHDKYRERMRAAKTPEERQAVRNDMRGTIEQRAKEKGVTLPRAPEGRPGPYGDGGRQPLFTPEERQQYRDKMRTAKTPEERAAMRQQMRELNEQRAREKGVTLPERRGRYEPSPAPAGKN